jgi:hypothetical protein
MHSRLASSEIVADADSSAEDDVFFDPILDTSACDEAAQLVLDVRRALAEGRHNSLRVMAHPLALKREHERFSRTLGAQIAASFWAEVTSGIDAVRMVSEGFAEVYEHARHQRGGATYRFVSTVEHLKGRWRMTDTREATDERIAAVLLRGAPGEEKIDGRAWTRAWEQRYGETAVLRAADGSLDHPVRGWRASVRSGSGRDVARTMALSGPSAELLEKQPAATMVSLVPALEARARTEQLQWIARAVSLLGARDASSVWVPSAAKALPYATWRSAAEGALDLPSLSALWLRTQRQRGAWVTRGMTNFMLPEVEVWCAGLNVAMVRVLLRDAVGRLLRHHHERVTLDRSACAAAVPGLAARLYARSSEGPIARPTEELSTAIALAEIFEVGDVQCSIGPGRQGPRPGETYGRWGAIALRPEDAWWSTAA